MDKPNMEMNKTEKYILFFLAVLLCVFFAGLILIPNALNILKNAVNSNWFLASGVVFSSVFLAWHFYNEGKLNDEREELIQQEQEEIKRVGYEKYCENVKNNSSTATD